MKRAQSMAQSAWARPALRLSSWSCMGPRRRATTAYSNAERRENSPESLSNRTESSEPLVMSANETAIAAVCQTVELPLSVSDAREWDSEIGCSCSDEIHLHPDGVSDLDGNEDLMDDNNTCGDHMTEVELWQQLEHDLRSTTEGEEADVAREIREEEEAAIAEVGGNHAQSDTPEMKEVHRFFPPGKIMHIVTIHCDNRISESDTPSSSELDHSQSLEDSKVGIFLTPRSLYSKLRLSQTMISDHFMPVYRRQIERLIKELEEEQASDDRGHKYTEDVVL